jgi:HAD superfamily hydrolase (TIGR01549 family)
MQQLAAIVFDLDGVILESGHLKADAFRQLFRAYPAQQDQIVQLHLTQGGLSRYEKLRRIYRDYLHLPLSDEEMCRLDGEFRDLVAQAMTTCPFVRGARELIERQAAERPLFIASGTPENELREVVAARELSQYFAGVYGSPRPKAELLQVILRQLDAPADAVLFIGDSIVDYEAALAAGVPFCGRVPPGEPSPFPSSQQLVVPDLADLEARLAAGIRSS